MTLISDHQIINIAYEIFSLCNDIHHVYSLVDSKSIGLWDTDVINVMTFQIIFMIVLKALVVAKQQNYQS